MCQGEAGKGGFEKAHCCGRQWAGIQPPHCTHTHGCLLLWTWHWVTLPALLLPAMHAGQALSFSYKDSLPFCHPINGMLACVACWTPSPLTFEMPPGGPFGWRRRGREPGLVCMVALSLSQTILNIYFQKALLRVETEEGTGTGGGGKKKRKRKGRRKEKKRKEKTKRKSLKSTMTKQNNNK